MSVKSLVAVLSFFVLPGKVSSVQQRVNALHAASLYLLLLGIPGEELKKYNKDSYSHICVWKFAFIFDYLNRTI